ncbi:MAG TPA: adenylate/guanylate cyclase domain-containing protein, partial [Verrucomicrobiae bacterium]|nr:adenylate/guanylate cyclase domain-containing protein [Verrucomicrobiae bacterium]
FTDLRGSTAMYNGIGDAPAYNLVRNHFQVLMDVVREHRGAIVKTIGDAIMAGFSRVDEALAAVKQMHERLPQASEAAAGPRLTLKTGLHIGPCLAVNANDRLDFFGTTVNLAARMVDCSQGNDVVISNELHETPDAQRFLAAGQRTAEPLELRFRGFDAPLKVWRIQLAGEPPPSQVAPATPARTLAIPAGQRLPASSRPPVPQS